MTDQSGLNDTRNDPQAQRVVREIERFVETFEERAGKHAADVILDGNNLHGSQINQEPERFVEDNLIEPIANALNLNVRFRPKGFTGLEGRIPDFTVLNLDIENFGEVKTPGQIASGRKESVEYLEMATERPIVGIATDGFTWILYTANESEKPTYTSHERIYDIIKKIRMEQAHERAERRSRPPLREAAYGLVSEFSKAAIKKRIQQ
ncbi:hypothetical protein IL252_13615 [Halomicrobium sp. IBSBa]|uniref:hypothetical protein n=1 Tax=Halomicrobium sp. IBSBa TaxID=2778916 RepID=UPI001ABF223A|nr:hypothetical protein [Halomicrobium sp. IBSBa]MBO4248857.1 hypothetical protein [Halomicrobium sp. IBSBa]